jgi:hypothetical protein
VSLRPADSRSSGREAVSGNCSQELQRLEPQKEEEEEKTKGTDTKNFQHACC